MTSARPTRSLHRFHTEYDIKKVYQPHGEPPLKDLLQAEFQQCLHSFNLKQFIRDRFPFLEAIKGYDRQGILQDFLTGISVSVLLIPQALAHTALAGMPISYALYIAFMPLIVYTFLGTCRQVCVGSFALVSLVVAQTIPSLIDGYDAILASNPARAEELYVETAMTLTLVVGTILLLMAILRLGWIISFFSKPAISGLLVSSAYVICTSQVGGLLQIKVKPDSSFIQSWATVFSDIHTAHPISATIGILSLISILVMDHYSRPPRFKNPPPVALIIVVITTIISFAASLHDDHDVRNLTQIYLPPLSSPHSLTLSFPCISHYVSLSPVSPLYFFDLVGYVFFITFGVF